MAAVTLTLHLGVYDQPYADAPAGPLPRPRKGRRARGPAPVATTGDVAKVLEARYDVMGGFFLLHGDQVAEACAEAMSDALDASLAGHPVPPEPLAPAMEGIADMFHEFIDREELAGLEEGVPTAAALKGVSHRFKHPYASGHPRRPSFVDTGLFRESFVAWVD